MMNIVEFADKCGVTPPIVIMWESMGLLTPSSRDEVTEMPLYTEEQLTKAKKISMLTAIGFSNAEIAKMLAAPLTKEVLISKRALFEETARRAAKSLEELDRQIRFATYEETFGISSLPPFCAYKKRKTFRTINYLTIEYLDIADRLREYGIKPLQRGHNRMMMTEKEYINENFTVDCLYAVSPESAGKYSEIREIPGIEKAAYMLFKAGPVYLKEAYEHLVGWIEINHYEINGYAAFVFTEPVFYEKGCEKAWTEMYIPIK